jgi:hypothetical protein
MKFSGLLKTEPNKALQTMPGDFPFEGDISAKLASGFCPVMSELKRWESEITELF